jgi:hypothetical protein
MNFINGLEKTLVMESRKIVDDDIDFDKNGKGVGVFGSSDIQD